MRATIFAVILTTLFVKEIEAYASYFASSSYCSQQLYDGVTMMGNVVHYGNSRSIIIKRGSTTLSSGDSYVAGESLTVSLSATATEYAFQVASGDATFSGGACSSKRRANRVATLIMPSSGTVVINGASAESEGTASMFADFTLNCCSVSTGTPSGGPTPGPSATPTVGPTLNPSNGPSVTPTTGPTQVPTVVPTTAAPSTRLPTPGLTEPTVLPSKLPSLKPTVAPSLIPSVAPSVGPSLAPTTIAPSVRPSLTPTSAPLPPTAAPTYLTETLLTYELSQVVNNITLATFLDNSEAFVEAMTSSLNTFLTPKTVSINSPTASSRRVQAGADLGSLTVVYNTAYVLEDTQYQTSADLQDALTVANSIISNSNLFVTTLKDQGVPALSGVASTSSDGVALGSTQLVTTVAPTAQPTESGYADDTFYNGSTTTKIIVGVVVGFVGVLIFLGLLHFFLFNHASLKTSYGEAAKKVPAWLAVAMGATALVLVVMWATKPDGNDYEYLGKPSWKQNVFAYHPVFLVAGFYFAQLIAINNWVMFDSHAVGKVFHVFFQMTGLAFMIAGMCAVVKFKLENKTPSLTTMHSWVGVGAVAIFCVNYALGFFMGLVTALCPNSLIRTAFDLRRVHQALGLISLGMTTIAVVSGVMDQLSYGECFYDAYSGFQADKDPAENYPHMKDSCRVALGMGIAVIVGAIMTVLSVSLRRHDPAPANHTIAANKVVIPAEEGGSVAMVPSAEDDKVV